VLLIALVVDTINGQTWEKLEQLITNVKSAEHLLNQKAHRVHLVAHRTDIINGQNYNNETKHF
jgi:hypothetical protein